MTACLATTGHCCWIAGAICPFVRDDGVQAARRFVCTLRERAGSWVAVHALPEYVEHVRPTLLLTGVDCGDWPPAGATCAECGATDG